MENEIERCPLCRNHCPVDHLGCERGRRYQAEKPAETSAASAAASGGETVDEKTENKTGKDSSREERLMSLFFQCAHIFHHRFWHARGQGRILHFLHHHGPMTQRELQEYAGIRSASLSELLEKAEAGGFLSRFRNTGDRRTVNVSLTDLGKKSALDFDEEKNEMDKSLFSALNEAEQEQLETLLSRLLSAWEATLEAEPCGFMGRGGGRGRGNFSNHRHRRFWRGE